MQRRIRRRSNRDARRRSARPAADHASIERRDVRARSPGWSSAPQKSRSSKARCMSITMRARVIAPSHHASASRAPTTGRDADPPLAACGANRATIPAQRPSASTERPAATPNASPAIATPSTTPVTGLSSPTTPTTPGGRRRSPANHATYATAVAITREVREAERGGRRERGRRPLDEQRDRVSSTTSRRPAATTTS